MSENSMKANEIVPILQRLRADVDLENEYQALCKAIEAVLQVAAFEEGDRARWIPVGERLPEKMGYYLTSRHGVVEKEVYLDFKRGFLHDGVEAWKPLPEPWKGDEK